MLIFNTDDEEPLLKDIPRDTSGSDEPFFKLPLPDEGEEDYYSDVEIIEVCECTTTMPTFYHFRPLLATFTLLLLPTFIYFYPLLPTFLFTILGW